MGELSPHSEDTLIEHLKFRRRVISATTCGISSKDERRAIENGKVEFRSGAKFPPPLAELLGAGAWHETANLRCDIGPPARHDVRYGSFATEPFRASAEQCPLCLR
jgi:hypothetical protein